MAKMSFKTKRGKTVSLSTSGRRKKGGKRKLSAYNRFAKKELKKQYAKGKSAKAAMRATAKAWRARK
jgi:hypothetical protein